MLETVDYMILQVLHSLQKPRKYNISWVYIKYPPAISCPQVPLTYLKISISMRILGSIKPPKITWEQEVKIYLLGNQMTMCN